MGIVQTKQGSSALSSLTITLDNPTGPASSLIVLVAASGTNSNPTAIACTLGGVAGNFTQDATFGSASDAAIGATWRDQPCASGQTAVGITATGGTGTIAITAAVYECDDLAASPFDKAASSVGTASGTWTSTATATTTQATERLFGGVFATGVATVTITGPSSPWNNLTQVNQAQGSFFDEWMSGWQDVSSTGTYTYNGTSTSTPDWIAKVVTYKLAAASAPAAVSAAQPGGTWLRRFHHRQQLSPPSPSQAATVNAGLATANGTAQGILAAIGVNAVVAAGTGAAQSPAAAAGVNAILATGTGTAQGPAVTTAASVTAVLATGTGTAQGAIPAVGVNAVLATAAGTAQNATASTSASGTANAVVATGTGAALNATATAASAPGAVLATGTGAALGPVAAVGVNAGLASGTGAAGQPAITAAASVTAVLAAGAGAALTATASTSSSGTANAVLATGTGAAQSPVTAIAVNAAAATGSGTAQAAGRAATAGLATGTGAAQTAAAIVAAQAQAQAAHALAAALNATAAAVEPFTVGRLTASDAPLAALTAGTISGAATLTASDTRTGGPG